MAEPLLGVVKMESWGGVADTEGETTIDWLTSLARKTVARASLMPEPKIEQRQGPCLWVSSIRLTCA
jgi:hypothetical protein